MDISTFAYILLASISLLSIVKPADADLLPNRTHCSAEVYYYNKESSTLDWYHVEEFVDFDRSRSSLELIDLGPEQKLQVFYNQRLPATSTLRRTFLGYDVNKNTCQKAYINTWPLSPIRKLLVNLLPFESLASKILDVSLGPAALLMGIELTAENFAFVRRKFSQNKLMNVDIFEMISNSEVNANEEKYITTVQLAAIGRKKLDPGSKTLAKILSSTSVSEDNEKRTGVAEIMTISICKVSVDRLKSRDPSKEYLCQEDTEFILEATYDQLSEWRATSLIGKTLDASTYFDFHREPFMRPIGLGCWLNDFAGQRMFTVPNLQFSGQFVAFNGTMNPTYLAYDGYRQLYRIDRSTRTSVYDMTEGKSYHWERGAVEARDMQEPISGPAPLECVVLEVEASMQPSDQTDAMSRLIGFSQANEFHYVGSKLIDHASYDVFETKLVPSDAEEPTPDLPLILEANSYLLDHKSNDYFITIYINDDRRPPAVAQSQEEGGKTRAWREDDATGQLAGSMAIKYLELWEVARLSKRRRLVNRVKFIEFSWSLEVLADEIGTELMKVGGRHELLGDLFQLEGCVKRRAGGQHLRFRLTEDISSARRLTKQQADALRANSDLVGEQLRRSLVSSLDLSHMNIAKLELAFLSNDSTSMLVDAELVNIESGQSKDKVWGYVHYDDFQQNLKNAIISVRANVHSLDQCKLDSLRQSVRGAKTVLLFCRGLSSCVLFDQGPASELMVYVKKEKPNESLLMSSDPTEAWCMAQEFSWSTSGRELGDELGASIRSNAFELTNAPVELSFKYQLNSGLETEKLAKVAYAKYVARISGVTLRTVDRFSLGNDGNAPLAGFRFAAPNEEQPDDRQVPVVTPISLDKIEGNQQKLRHCHAACQMDEFCMSFSLCLSKKTTVSQSSDCLLSSLRINNELVGQIAKGSKATTVEGSSFDVETQDGLQFRLRRHIECNIHAKDVVASYRLVKIIKTRPASDNSTEQNSLAPFTEGKTLEDCAADSFETWLTAAQFSRSNFTYCPLDSACFQDQVKTRELPRGQVCNVYRPFSSQFYDKRLGSRLMVSVNQTRKYETADFLKLGIGKRMLGLSIQECARDCNMLYTKCLAFDYCKTESDESFCMLYIIRSPLSGSNFQQSPLLPFEEDFYGDTLAAGVLKSEDHTRTPPPEVITSNRCSHYFLRRPYLDIKVSRIHASILSGSESGALLGREAKQISEDNELANKDLAKWREEREQAEQNGPSGSAGLHPILFLFGLALGLVGLLHGRQIGQSALDFYETQRARLNERHRGPRLSHLALANPLDDA